MKNKKETTTEIEIEIALIIKKSSYIRRALTARLQKRGLTSHSHEKLYPSEINERNDWMTSNKKMGND